MHFKTHWDYLTGLGGLLATVTMRDFNEAVAGYIGAVTAIFVTARLAIWLFKVRMAWRQRNNPGYFNPDKQESED